MAFVKRVNTQEAEDALAALATIGAEHQTAREKLDAIARQRDQAILKASHAGAARRDVAAAARVTAGRVQQIITNDGAARD